MKMLFTSTLLIVGASFFVALILWTGRALYVRRIRHSYRCLEKLDVIVMACPENHVPKVSAQYAASRVKDYQDVVSSRLYPEDHPMLVRLANRCSWLRSESEFNIMFSR